MGKGYNNYMCKKPFHPGSKANIKRAWMAEQKTENEKRKQDELKVQYEKEQDLYNNRALISSESKDKLELNFMYEAPPGAKRERQKEDDEPEYKFEWQRKYNAPREDYAKGNEDIKDQPFGIPVRNVRCIKCHKWGHINTDKECPMYHQASSSSMPTTSMDPMELMKQMKEDGFGLKEHVLGHQMNPAAANQQFIPSDESDPEMDFLKSLSTAEKKKLLRKLKKLSKKQKNCKKKKSKKTKKSKAKNSSSSESEKEKNTKKKKKSKKSSSSSGDDSSSSSSDESVKRKKKKRNKSKHSDSNKDPSKSQTSSKRIETINITKPSDSSTKNRAPVTKQDKSNCKRTEDQNSKPERECSQNYALKIEEKKESPVKNKSKNMDLKYSKSDKIKTIKKERKTSCSEDEKPKIQTQDAKTKQLKSEDDSKVKIRKLDMTELSESCKESDAKKMKCDHPDGFSHLCPQAHVKDNYVLPEEEYKGKVDDKFRYSNRDKRSPSVKQKYNI